jgi:hypothetical protein
MGKFKSLPEWPMLSSIIDYIQDKDRKPATLVMVSWIFAHQNASWWPEFTKACSEL